MKSAPSTTGVACVMTVLALTSAACGGGWSSSDSPSASAPAPSDSDAAPTAAAPPAAADPSETAVSANFAPLLITPYDIDLPGETFTAGQPQANPGGHEGVAVTFVNEGQTRTIADSIGIFADAAAAKAALDAAVAALDQSIAAPSPQPAEVGENGQMASGDSPDGAKAVTVVAFTTGPTFVRMQFDSAAGDPVPDEMALALAEKQSGLIQSSLG
jgi:hypothetical protein